ncbi:sensor histidine kinase [Microtetraspora sp. AC03309]|uniref:sensor histidine kinase n=1 Tax=Microtetraspora sp. AC03309 TaxID=2779376 RepID=UPI001E32544F|nr:sensor histidine kinase [Microtetraspora sp. AC03309]
MREETLRPPLTQRLPHGVRTALTWCAVVAILPLLYAVTLADDESLLPVGAMHAGFAAAIVLPLVWAGRRPCAVLAVLLAELLVAMALAQPAERIWPLMPVADILVCFLTATRSRRTGLAAATTTLIVQEAAWHVALLTRGLRVFASGFLALSVLLGLGVVVAWMAGTALRQRREYGQALRAQAELQAVTADRLRIARELHDMVAHSIGVIAIQAGAGARVIDSRPEQARDALGAIEAASRQTLQGLRHMLGVLREPPAASEPEPAPLSGLADLDRLAETTTAAGVRVDVRHQGKPRGLPPAVDRCAFRIVQESVTNVVRHADARHCQVVLDYAPEELRIDIADDGRGTVTTPASPGSGYGIAGMRERAALLDGRLSAGPRPEGGFRVTATLPLPDPAAALERAQTTHVEAR